MNKNNFCSHVNRRTFLAGGTLFIAGVSGFSGRVFSQPATEPKPILRIALFTDIHHADKAAAGSRYYRESLDKLAVAKAECAKKPVDFAMELGDFIDSAADVETEKKHLRTVHTAFTKICKNRHYVLGNHCVDTLTKEEFLGEVGQEKSFYSFNVNGWHFVVLDACFRRDGAPYGRKNADWTDTKIPEEELEWLRADLVATSLPSLVFLHQRLDLENQHAYSVKNADQVRAALEASGKVRLVLQGHDHKGDYKEIGGITYCTLSALIEGSGEKNNAFSVLEILENADMRLHGFFKQESRSFPKPVRS